MKNTTKSSTSSTGGPPSGVWLSSSRAYSNQSSTNGERAKENRPRISYNNSSKSNQSSLIYKTQKTWNCKSFNNWSVSRASYPTRISNPSASKTSSKKHSKPHSKSTQAQLSSPLCQSQMRRRRLWSTTRESKTFTSRPTYSATTYSSFRNQKASVKQLPIQKRERPRWLLTKFLSTLLQSFQLYWAIISKRKISSRWLRAHLWTSF